MAQIDTSTIEGYDGMTVEQKLAALEGFDIPEPDYTGYVKKDIYDKAAHDAADWKKKHNALLSEDERLKAEREEHDAQIQEELESLRKEKTISTATSALLAQGYSAESAKTVAEAMASGDSAAFFSANAAALEAMRKASKAEKMKKMTPPAPGGDPGHEGEDPGAKYDKLAQEALDNGNRTSAARYFRLASEARAEQAE